LVIECIPVSHPRRRNFLLVDEWELSFFRALNNQDRKVGNNYISKEKEKRK
jgi:hypothetical protein